MAQKEFTTGEMMKTLDFFVLIACFFACGTGGMYISATYKNYGEDVLPNSDDPAASWGGFRALACACSRRLLRFAGGGSGSDRCR